MKQWNFSRRGKENTIFNSSKVIHTLNGEKDKLKINELKSMNILRSIKFVEKLKVVYEKEKRVMRKMKKKKKIMKNTECEQNLKRF